uniref:Uncharacterized protein n=1 Tax=Anguilla anguilla TaxID=7936 RepID=A0A0E9Y0J6_ANGAN
MLTVTKKTDARYTNYLQKQQKRTYLKTYLKVPSNPSVLFSLSYFHFSPLQQSSPLHPSTCCSLYQKQK